MFQNCDKNAQMSQQIHVCSTFWFSKKSNGKIDKPIKYTILQNTFQSLSRFVNFIWKVTTVIHLKIKFVDLFLFFILGTLFRNNFQKQFA
jgi:hypothetical protein